MIRLAHLLLPAFLFLLGVHSWAQDGESPAEAPDAAPVPFPKLEHFAALWERSLFTTREIPLPASDEGPKFTDQLSLAGVYEVDGEVVAVIVDKTTSLVSEARIGSENAAGIRIKEVESGALPSATRIQLLKNGQLGWVGFDQSEMMSPAGAMTPPPGTTVRPAIPVRPVNRTPAAPPPPPAASLQNLPINNSASPVSDIPLPPE